MAERAANSIEQVTALMHVMERDLAALRQELDHSQRLCLVGTLAAGIAHEVNNLLTPARGYAQMLEQSDLDESLQRKACARISEAIDAAGHVLEAILDFSAVGKEEGSADVSETLSSALDCLGGDLAREGVRLSRAVPPGTRVAISPIALQQVLLNLLLNARTALTDGGGGALSVSAMEYGDGTTVITVADDGPGIPEAIADAIFEPFVTSAARSERAVRTVEQRGGSGLGLAVCRRIVEAARGSITVDSSPGAGASFAVRLPSLPRQSRAKAG